MSLLKHLVITVCACIATQCAVLAQESPATKIIGQWREYDPSNNLVEFAKDGTWKMFLKKGEIPNLRVIDGTWVLANDGTLTVMPHFLGKKVEPDVSKLSFEGDELVLTQGKSGKTSHRRHKGPLPDEYQW